MTKIEDGIHKIELENGEYRQVTKFELGLFKSISLRKSVETIVKVPLQKEGIDTVRFAKEPGSDDIKKAEAEHFTAPILDEEILGEPILSKEVLQLVSVTFQENNKWRFSDGNTVFYADVKDEGFLNRVANNEVAFSKGDLLEVELEKRQTLVSGSLRTEYSVLEVNNHRSAMTQISLPLHDS